MLARAAEFDVILVEALDRISRDQEDVAAIWKRVGFAGSRLHTVSEDAIGEIQIGFTSAISAVFLKNLGDKTRRGQVERVAAERIMGGLCYGSSRTSGSRGAVRSSGDAGVSCPRRPRLYGGSSTGRSRAEARPGSSSA
ncbi:recombinase family protein [Sphingomonas sp. MA1305]|nr:recombinase family protein [Sphingomonas sp. MA1305]